MCWDEGSSTCRSRLQQSFQRRADQKGQRTPRSCARGLLDLFRDKKNPKSIPNLAKRAEAFEEVSLIREWIASGRLYRRTEGKKALRVTRQIAFRILEQPSRKSSVFGSRLTTMHDGNSISKRCPGCTRRFANRRSS